MDTADWIPVGKLWRSRGNRGELVAEIYSSKPGRAEQLHDVVLSLGANRREAVIERLWYHNSVPVFKFAGIDSISDAEAWEGADILVPPEDRIEVDEGEFTHADLEGCRLIDANGGIVGIVKSVEELGGPPMLLVESPGGRELMIPFARAICKEIDIAGKAIQVELPEGLLDL